MNVQERTTIKDRLGWQLTAGLYDRVRSLWKDHAMAEDRRDLDGLVATLTPDCVYEIFPTRQRWVGHDGARAFYTAFLGAFPDVKFELVDIAIGPQGVIEIVDMTGTHRGEWAGIAPTGEPVSLRIVIHFPWDPDAERFAGENVYFDTAALRGAGA